MDAQIEAFFHYLFVSLPMSCIPYLMAAYVYAVEFSQKAWKQTKISWGALYDSFQDDYMRFYEVINNSIVTHIPIVTKQQNMYNYQSKWIYSISEKTFVLCEIHHDASTHRLPFIGASLEMIENGKTEVVGDMSEWLMDQTVFAPSAVIPLQLLAAAWLYTAQTLDPTLVFTYRNMRMRVVNEEGEEKVYALDTEQEIEEGEIVEAEADRG
jgi:hypothetical protein